MKKILFWCFAIMVLLIPPILVYNIGFGILIVLNNFISFEIVISLLLTGIYLIYAMPIVYKLIKKQAEKMLK